ncbi:MAG: GNAT family N-acetyltransferase [Vampirovibrionales bacterium]|nr:GNAT family N-acetyltransferase [Vampirovibrionales bacterium]
MNFLGVNFSQPVYQPRPKQVDPKFAAAALDSPAVYDELEISRVKIDGQNVVRDRQILSDLLQLYLGYLRTYNRPVPKKDHDFIKQYLSDTLQYPRARIYLAYKQKDGVKHPAGFIVAVEQMDATSYRQVYFQNLFVDEGFRENHIAEALISKLVEDAWADNNEKIELKTFVGNKAARDLYEKGERRYYPVNDPSDPHNAAFESGSDAGKEVFADFVIRNPEARVSKRALRSTTHYRQRPPQ